jgi:hypothetical protein
MLKRRLGKQAVADLLYEDVFRPLSDNISAHLGERLVGTPLLDNPSTKIRFNLECFYLTAFLVTFSFQREFEYLGHDASNFILDYFHNKLFENLSETCEGNKFSEQLKSRYAEYYPSIKEDLRCLKVEGTVLFRGIIDSFFNKIAPDKLKSMESILFGLFLADLYPSICETYNKIKDYEIG